MAKIKIPKKGESTEVELANGKKIRIEHQENGLGDGGIVKVKNESGDTIIHDSYGSRSENAFSSLSAVTKHIQATVGAVKNVIKAQKSSGYTSGAGGSNSGYKPGASGSGMYEDAPF